MIRMGNITVKEEQSVQARLANIRVLHAGKVEWRAVLVQMV